MTVAPVNDITAQQEQIQLYISAIKPDNIKSDDIDMTHYQDSCILSGKRIEEKNQRSSHYCENIQSTVVSQPAAVISSKVYTNSRQHTYENSRISCDAPDEYVDINDMEFIQTKDEHGTEKENMLMRRAHKKRTIKKNEECKLRKL